MLSLKERQEILKIYRLVSILGLFPVSVDPEKWEIRSGCGSKWKSLVCTLSVSLFGAHAAYKCASLLYAFNLYPPVPLYKLVIHADLAIATLIFAFWYYIMYVKDGSLHSQLAGLILTTGSTEGTMNEFVPFGTQA